MAELHVLGQIVGGSHFQRKNIFCKVSAPWAVISPPSSLSLTLSLRVENGFLTHRAFFAVGG